MNDEYWKNEVDKTGEIGIAAGLVTRMIIYAIAGWLLKVGITAGEAGPILFAVLFAAFGIATAWVKAKKLQLSPPPAPPASAPIDPSKVKQLGLILTIGVGALCLTGCANWNKQHPTQQVNSIRESSTTIIKTLTDYRAAGRIGDEEYKQIDGLMNLLDQRLADMQFAADRIADLEKRQKAGEDVAQELTIAKANWGTVSRMHDDIINALLAWQIKVQNRT